LGSIAFKHKIRESLKWKNLAVRLLTWNDWNWMLNEGNRYIKEQGFHCTCITSDGVCNFWRKNVHKMIKFGDHCVWSIVDCGVALPNWGLPLVSPM
jgi:hypothetical protein